MSEATPEATPAIETIVLLEQNKIKMNDPNGTFTINLPRPITLHDGDSINLSKSFIDTSEADTSFITIDPEDSEVVITTGLYINDLEKNIDGPARPSFGLWSGQIADRPRGTTFILSNHSEVNLHTYLDWQNVVNPQIPGVQDFIIELTTIDAAFAAANTAYIPYLDKAHYVLTGKPLIDPAEVGVDPDGIGRVIQQKFILGGFMNMATINNKHEFFYYNRNTTPDECDITTQNHVAVFDIWNDTDGKTRLGWRAKKNPDTIYPASGQNVLGKWTFAANNDGYNYFSDGGKPHGAIIKTLRFPISKSWDAGLASENANFPSVELEYPPTPFSKVQPPSQAIKIFNQYPPSSDQRNKGLLDLLDILDNGAPGYSPSKFTPHNQLPRDFRKKEHDWGHDWLWYDWSNWVDPKDPTGKTCFPSFEYDIHDPPMMTTTSNNPRTGFPNFNAFLNPASQFGVIDPTTRRWVGNRCQPYQFDLTPMSNPSSTGCTLTPRRYTTKFTIPPGDYTYSDLAQFITDKLNQLESPVLGLQNNPNDPLCPLNAAGFSNSYLIQDTYSLSMQYDGLATAPVAEPTSYPNNYTFSAVTRDPRLALNINTGVPEQIGQIVKVENNNPGKQPYWVSEDGNDLFQFNADKVFEGITDGVPAADAGAGPRVFGAENFSLIFDDSSSRFKIIQAHTPIYLDGPILAPEDKTATPPKPAVVGPGAAVIRQIGGAVNPEIGFKGEQLTIDTSSGAFIYNLEPKSLWEDKLRFDSSILTPVSAEGSIQNFTTGESSFSANVDLAAAKTFPMSLQTGVNKTGYFTSVDLLVKKQASFSLIDANGGQDIETATPAGLEGSPLLAAGNDQAFYNIEMSGINNQEFSGQTYNNSLIQGLVGKYYSQGNFTQSESDGIQYIHKGETPLVIQSIRTRILDTQLQPEDGLGPNSAFILTINKTK